MISLSFLNRLLTAAFITTLLIVSGCGILPSGPNQKTDLPLKPSFAVQIDSANGPQGYGVLQGHYLDVKITTTCENGRLQGFDLLLAYEPEVLTPVDIDPGDYFQQGNWEYFDYELLIDTLESDGSIISLIKITAVLDTMTTVAQKVTDDSLPASIAIMKFLVTDDRTFECHHSPLRFYWRDCDDNRFYMRENDGIAISLLNPSVSESETDSLPDPSRHGPPLSCLSPKAAAGMIPVEFINGGVEIICGIDIDNRGDINLNGLMNEIADAYLYVIFFITGMDAFGDHIEASVVASDVNADGIGLSVADLVYLIRIIMGDARPYPHMQPGGDLEILTNESGGNLIVSYETNSDVGAVWLQFLIAGEIEGSPELVDHLNNMDMEYNTTGDTLKVIIYNIGPNSIPAGTGELMRIPVDGSLTLIEADAGDYYGACMNVRIRNIRSMNPLKGSQR